MYSMQERNTEYKPQTKGRMTAALAIAAGRIVPGMTEAQASEVALSTAWPSEDEEGYVAALLEETEAREGHRLSCLYGPYSDF